MIKEELREYYETAKLWLPENSGWRFFKVILQNKRCIYIKDRIHSTKILRKHLLKMIDKGDLPYHIYYSSSTFLNPTTAEKQDFKYGDRIFLYNDLVFDVDEKTLDEAKATTEKILAFMENEKGYFLKYILFTGRGFHIVYKDLNPISKPEPYQREIDTRNKRVYLVQQMKKSGIDWDSEITVDMNRVIRLPNTINMKTGNLTQFIFGDLKTFIPHSPKVSLPILCKECMLNEKR